MMTTEELRAIRQQWALDVKSTDRLPDSLMAHENELRQTIRDLCDELLLMKGEISDE